MLRWAQLFQFLALRADAEPSRSGFGHHLRSEFLLADGYTNLNHGSYGATPRQVANAERKWQQTMEQNPDYWFRYSGPGTLFGELDRVRELLAKYINASAKDVVFVDNASGGVNAVLRSIRLPPSAAVLYLNTAYQMVKETITYVSSHDGQEASHELKIKIPSSDAEIVDLVESELLRNPSIRLASFSHITSAPAIILPVGDLVRICHKHGVMVLIDGAHALGQIPIDVQDIAPDFYVGNGHKWLYSPKGSAILWVAPSKQHLIHPNIINYEGQGATAFQQQFSYTGTKDYSAYLAMGDALQFREQLLGGDVAIMKYMHDLAVQGGKLLAKAWGTDLLVDESSVGAMVNVGLPDTALPCCDIMGLSTSVFKRYNTWVPAIRWNGHCFMRVSAQVYNEMTDFEMLANAVSKTLQDGCNASSNSLELGLVPKQPLLAI